MNFIAQATQPAPSQLASDIVYVLGAIGTFVGVVLAAFALYRSSVANNKATAADVKATTNDTRINNTVRDVNAMRSDLTSVALRTPTGTGNGGPLPGGLTGGNIDRPKP